MKMGSKHVLQRQKLELLGIIKEAMFIHVKNINFFFFTLITSFPLFCFLVSSETLLKSTLIEISHTLNYYQPSFHLPFTWPTPFNIIINSDKELLYRLVQLCLLYLVPFHLLEFIFAFRTVNMASDIYAEERKMSLKEIVQKPIHKAKLRAAFITSVYAHALSAGTLLGLICLVTTYYAYWNSVVNVFVAVFRGAAFFALLMKYMEWSAAWKMSVVISIVEEKYGMDALVISDYFNRGSERRGLFLMLFFYGWDFVIRMVGLYWCGIIFQVCLLCLCNSMTWMASMVYFYDCKSRVLEKKVDEEIGGEIKGIDK